MTHSSAGSGSADQFVGSTGTSDLFTVDGGVEPRTVAEGTITLSSGSGQIDTGVDKRSKRTFYVLIGPSTDGAEVGITMLRQSGTYVAQIDETSTSVGNPTIDYEILELQGRRG